MKTFDTEYFNNKFLGMIKDVGELITTNGGVILKEELKPPSLEEPVSWLEGFYKGEVAITFHNPSKGTVPVRINSEAVFFEFVVNETLSEQRGVIRDVAYSCGKGLKQQVRKRIQEWRNLEDVPEARIEGEFSMPSDS